MKNMIETDREIILKEVDADKGVQIYDGELLIENERTRERDENSLGMDSKVTDTNIERSDWESWNDTIEIEKQAERGAKVMDTEITGRPTIFNRFRRWIGKLL